MWESMQTGDSFPNPLPLCSSSFQLLPATGKGVPDQVPTEPEGESLTKLYQPVWPCSKLISSTLNFLYSSFGRLRSALHWSGKRSCEVLEREYVAQTDFISVRAVTRCPSLLFTSTIVGWYSSNSPCIPSSFSSAFDNCSPRDPPSAFF